jgi:hypothetical protein
VVGDYSGFEPQVGEIRAVRTFRVGPGGWLYPLFGTQPWRPGTNEATCRLVMDPEAHRSPEPECSCGWYAYSSAAAAAEYPYARYVLAVVACWGRVVAGTRGLRAQFARIEAIWLAPVVPPELDAQVAVNYPDVVRYDEREDMLSAHPPTRLDLGDPERVATPLVPPLVARTVAAAAVGFGAVPTSWIGRLPDGWWIWTAVLVATLLAALLPDGALHEATARRRRLICFALMLWMLAPLVGVVGVVFLRLPLVQIALLITVHRAAMHKLARTFPAPI